MNEPNEPTKPADNTYTYSFKAWDKDVVAVAGDVIYTATYDATYIEYSIVFKAQDGTVLTSATYHYGQEVVVPELPTKESDNTYTYTAKWDKEVIDCTGNAVYTVVYEGQYIDYTVIFKDYDNTVLSTEKYHCGETIVAPANPTRAADNTYTYSFKAWDKELVACAGDATYVAIYDATYIDYTIVFRDYNSSIIASQTYHYGDVVNPPVPEQRPADDTHSYSFIGWDKEIANCTGDAVYYAQYKETEIEKTPSEVSTIIMMIELLSSDDLSFSKLNNIYNKVEKLSETDKEKVTNLDKLTELIDEYNETVQLVVEDMEAETARRSMATTAMNFLSGLAVALYFSEFGVTIEM